MPKVEPRRLVVDARNVIGSRPDGWWRDIDAAVRRLTGRLRRYATATETEITVVIDGHPIDGVPEGRDGRLDVHYAPDRGPDAADDHIVQLLEIPRPTTVVTADRDLRARAAARGADLEGPQQLLARLDQLDGN